MATRRLQKIVNKITRQVRDTICDCRLNSNCCSDGAKNLKSISVSNEPPLPAYALIKSGIEHTGFQFTCDADKDYLVVYGSAGNNAWSTLLPPHDTWTQLDLTANDVIVLLNQNPTAGTHTIGIDEGQFYAIFECDSFTATHQDYQSNTTPAADLNLTNSILGVRVGFTGCFTLLDSLTNPVGWNEEVSLTNGSFKFMVSTLNSMGSADACDWLSLENAGANLSTIR